MPKTATFTDSEKDKKRIDEISAFQKEKKLPSFIAAVRMLVDISLKMDKELK